MIAACFHVHIKVASVYDHDIFDRGAIDHGKVDVGLEGRGHPPAIAGIGGDDDAGLGVVTAVEDGIGAEAAENDGVGHADASAGQHGNGQLRHHGHVNGGPIAGLQAQTLQHVGELAHLHVQLTVGEDPSVARLAFPVEGHPVTLAGLDMTVQAVVGDVELAPYKPLGEGQLPVQHGVEILKPGDVLTGLPGPKGFVVCVGFFPHRPVGDQGTRHELCRWRKSPLFVVEVGDGRLVWHPQPPFRSVWADVTHQTPSASQT